MASVIPDTCMKAVSQAEAQSKMSGPASEIADPFRSYRILVTDGAAAISTN
jgi:hypothetical protein